MAWRDIFAVVLAFWMVAVVVRSMLLRGGGRPVPLRGKVTAAKEWLEDNGYQIVRVRERAEWLGYYGDKEFRKPLIADFIVRQGARYYAVKILNARDTGVNGLKLRDQWYPLQLAFGVNGVLHIDVDGEKVHTVDFEVKSPGYVLWRKFFNRSLWFLAGVVIALAWLHGR